MTTNERDKLMELLKRFSQEYCCEDMVEDWNYCKSCPLHHKECCQMVNLISQYLNDEIEEKDMIREINFNYNNKN